MKQPLDVQQLGDTELLMSWQDGHRSLYSFQFLRLNCPCAGCRDEWTGKRLISLDKIPSDIHPLETQPVGLYAFRFRWSDHHEAGIYGFQFLRDICPCDACQSQKEKND